MFNFGADTGWLSEKSLLQQRYIIEKRVGRGGMGAVYRAVDTRAGGRRVAIKEMSQSKLKDTAELQDAIARFQGEATMLHACDHANLPHVYDWFEEDGRSYLVMDFIDGKSLLEVLNETPGQPLPVEQVLRCAIQLCDVLIYLHQKRPPIIFRDLKPANIMLTTTGQVFLIDFGIARFFKPGQTEDTMAFGTPGYAAPEQGVSQTTPRSDLYSLGATLYCCLTAQDPAKAQVLLPARHYNPGVPVELEQLIQCLVQKKEQLRPQSAAEVQRALLKILQHANTGTVHFPATAPPSSALPPTVYPVAAVAPTPQPSQASSQIPATSVAQAVSQDSLWERFDTWFGDITLPLVRWYDTVCKPYLMQQLSSLARGVRARFPLWVKHFEAVVAQGEQQAKVLATQGEQQAKIVAQQAKVLAVQGEQRAKTLFSALRVRVPALNTAWLGTLWTMISQEYPPVWTVSFKRLFAVVLALALGVGLYAFTASHSSYSAVAFSLSLLLLLVVGGAMFIVRDTTPRSILLVTGITALIASVAFQVSPNVQQLIAQMLQDITLNRLFAVLLPLLALVPFFRVVPLSAACGALSILVGNSSLPLLSSRSLRLGPWIEHLPVSGVAFSCVLLQYGFGNTVTLLPLSSSIVAGTSFTLNSVFIGVLALVAIIPLFQLSRELGGWDRFVILLSAADCALLQYSLGDIEIQHIFPSASSLLVDILSLSLVVVMGAACIIAWGRLRRPPSQWDRATTLACAMVCALLQWNWLYLPAQQTILITSAVTLSQLLFLLLGIATLALLVRLLSRPQFSRVDRVIMFLVAIACTFLQYSFWYAQATNLPTADGVLHLLSFQILLAIGLGVAAIVLLCRLAYDFKGIDRLTVLGIAITAALLQYDGGSLPGLSFDMHSATANLIQVVTFNQFIAFILWCAAFITLVRLVRSRPFNGFDRFTVLLGAGACALLPFTQVLPFPVVSPNIQYPTGYSAFHQFAIIALAAALVTSLFWLRRKFSRTDRLSLLAMFGAAALCLCLGYFARQDGWLALALVLLILGVLVAIQMERVGIVRK